MIAVQGLTKIIDGKIVLNNVNFRIERGEAVAIMGPSGCGKTTLLKCLSGLIRPSSGSIIINNQNITELSEQKLNRLRKKIGLVFQYAALFDYMTVGENIEFGLTRTGRYTKKELKLIIAELLERVGLKGTEPLYPSQLSGGMRKRVGLARALALNPELLLYDEPTSGLDPVTAYAIDALIVSMQNKMNITSVVVSHDVSSVMRVAERVIMLSDGQVIAEGTPKEITQSKVPQAQAFIARAAATEIDAEDLDNLGE